jgi:hypothetical protein
MVPPRYFSTTAERPPRTVLMSARRAIVHTQDSITRPGPGGYAVDGVGGGHAVLAGVPPLITLHAASVASF